MRPITPTFAKLLMSSTPAKVKWRMDNPTSSTTGQDVAHLIHKLVLGAGEDICVVKADSWRTKEAKSQRATAHASRQIAVLEKDFEAASKAVNVIKCRLEDYIGESVSDCMVEDKVEWTHHDFDCGEIPARGRIDLISRDYVVDVKTETDASLNAQVHRIFKLGYDIQMAAYMEAVQSDRVQRKAALFFCEITPPYATSFLALDEAYVALGGTRWGIACRKWHECHTSGFWPDYGGHVVSPPKWALSQYGLDCI